MGLIYRLEKGSRLTHEQLDENFRYLNSIVAEVAAKTEIASSQVSVIPLGGLSYAVRADSYPIPLIGGIDYSAAPMTITLATADPVYDRLDLLYADVNNNIGKITGVADVSITPPDYDAETQYFIRFILVKAGALVGTDPITDTDIVDYYLYKNGGENGFVPTANNASITINNTVTPISETQDVKGYLTSMSHKFTLTSPVELNFADFDNFIFDCKVTPEHQYWFIYFFTANRSSVIGTNLFSSGTYGLDKTIATAQTCIIPIKDVFPKTSTFNRVVIFATQPNGIWQVDNVRLGKGSGLVPLNHTHTNLSVLETITSTLISNWNTAYNWVLTNGANVLAHIANKQNSLTVDGTGAKYPTVDAVNAGLATKLDASAYNQHFKGKYLTAAAMRAAHPTASVGDSAQVNEIGATTVVNYSWDDELGDWVITGSVSGGAANTDELPEGTSNLYFTTARVAGKEDTSNKKLDIEANKLSDVFYAPIKPIVDWVIDKLEQQLNIGLNSSKGVILGDSSISAYAGQNGVDYYLMKDSDLYIGTTITNNAVPGDTINQQKAVWIADTNKAIYDWIVVEIGLNDVGFLETDAAVLARYQSLIDTINADKKPSAIIVVATMTPAKARWTELFGSTNGSIAQTQWENMNIAIMGGGVNKITGVQYRVNKHTEALGDGVYNLANIYAVDLIHGNNAARNIIANSWREILNSAQYLTSVAPDVIDKYFNSTGSTIYNKDGQFSIGSKSVEIGRMKVANISGSAYNSLFTTNDYVFGSTGSSLLLEFGAPFGNTSTKFSATSNGSYAWSTLIFQEGGGNVLIGSATDNGNKLQVNGRGKFESSVQVGDNTAVASAALVGATRYREDANNSYEDVCMKVGVGAYAWVNKLTNTW